MHVISIMRRRFWQRDDGQTASIFGSLPWTAENDRQRWQMITSGFSLQYDDGSVHSGGETFAEARQLAREINEAAIERYRAHAEAFPETYGVCLNRIAQIRVLRLEEPRA